MTFSFLPGFRYWNFRRLDTRWPRIKSTSTRKVAVNETVISAENGLNADFKNVERVNYQGDPSCEFWFATFAIGLNLFVYSWLRYLELGNHILRFFWKFFLDQCDRYHLYARDVVLLFFLIKYQSWILTFKSDRQGNPESYDNQKKWNICHFSFAFYCYYWMSCYDLLWLIHESFLIK